MFVLSLGRLLRSREPSQVPHAQQLNRKRPLFSFLSIRRGSGARLPSDRHLCSLAGRRQDTTHPP